VIATVNSLALTLAAIAWNPEIRNILSVLVGVVVLCGSVYLLVGSNVGLRTGLLVSLCGLFGWMTAMGFVWWLYAGQGIIGMQGTPARWHVLEVNYSDQDQSGLADASLEEAHRLVELAELPTAQELIEAEPALAEEILPPELFLEGAEDDLAARIENITVGQVIEVAPELAEQYDDALDGWRLLPLSDRQRGDAAATADAFLGPEGRGLFTSVGDYLVRDVYSFGGKPQRSDDSLWGRFTHKASTIINFRHPTHYALVQVQPVVEVEAVPGQAPPAPELDEEAPVISVVLVRDLGDRRLPAAMTTVLSGVLFALFAWALHRRDGRIAEARAA
jgi:hypothetical protein